jgi:periplasmic copper chaperone A
MRTLISALLLCSFQAMAVPSPALSVNNGEIRQPMPGRTVAAGYLTLHNHSEQDALLDQVSSPGFLRVELHQHSHKDGVMRMEQLNEITIPAGDNVALAPGGLHLMLFEPTNELKVGQSVELLLHFADGQQLSVALPVVAMPKR